MRDLMTASVRFRVMGQVAGDGGASGGDRGAALVVAESGQPHGLDL